MSQQSPPPFSLPHRLNLSAVTVAALAVALIVAGVALLLLVGGIGFQTLSSEEPVTHPDGLYLKVEGEAKARVRVKSISSEVLLSGEAGRRWRTAMEALPPHLEPVGPLFTVRVRGQPPDGAVLEIEIPPGQAAQTLDLYTWDTASGEWVFVPGHADPDQGVIRVTSASLPPNLCIFAAGRRASHVASVLEPGQTVSEEARAALSLLLPAGLRALPDGSLDGALAEGFDLGAGYDVAPLVRASADTLAALLSDQEALESHADNLLRLADGYDGVALEYPGLEPAQREEFTAMLARLSDALHADDKQLIVLLPRPSGSGQRWDPGAYDWAAIGAAADVVVLRLHGSPGAYHPGGVTEDLIGWAVGEVERGRLYVSTSSLSVDEWVGNSIPVTLEDALSLLGTVAVQPPPEGSGFEPDGELVFGLAGRASHLERDPTTGLYRYQVYGSEASHLVWIVTAEGLRQRLDLLGPYHLGGVLVRDLLAEGNDPAVIETLAAYRANLASAQGPELELHWTVSDAEGTLLNEIASLDSLLRWSAPAEGDYTVSASLAGPLALERGAVMVHVGADRAGSPAGGAVAYESVPFASEAALPAIGPGGADPVQPPWSEVWSDPARRPELAIPLDLGPPPPPVAVAGTSGPFELGGQVENTIRYAGLMRQAGMTWVKFQVKWSPDMNPDSAIGPIGQARANGFKVLISLTGQQTYPSQIDYKAFTDFVAGVAELGPDAIEIWNEENIDFEWPAGQIDGATYVVKMLAPAFNAIKSVDPSIMVISGALAPTGYWGSCAPEGCDDWLYLRQMAAVGAANYMDCVGAHFNAGATSPTATSGHPGDGGDNHYTWYYSKMAALYGGTFGHPICFTELGYLTGEGYGTVPPRFNWAAGTTVAQQAQWHAETVQVAKQSGNVRLLIVWNVDFVNWGSDPMGGYAIIRPGGACPACDALDKVMP